MRPARALFPLCLALAGAGAVVLPPLGLYVSGREEAAPLALLLALPAAASVAAAWLLSGPRTGMARNASPEDRIDGPLARANLDALVERLPVAVLEVDPEGMVAGANPAARDFLGMDPVGGHLTDFSGPEGADGLMESLARALSEGEAARVAELEPGETALRVEAVFVAMAGPGGPSSVMVALKDLREREALAAELERTRRDADAVSENLRRTIKELEEFALIAVRREMKMQEIREMFKRLRDETSRREAG